MRASHLAFIVWLLPTACANRTLAVPDAAVDGATSGAGRYLIYNRQVAGHKHLFRAFVDGSQEIQLTSGAYDNVYPSIHGDLVYFASGGRTPNDPNIYIMTMGLDGSNVQTVPIALPNSALLQPSFCGTSLVFAAVVPAVHNHLEVYRVDIGGGTPTRLTTTTQGRPNDVWAQFPSCDVAYDQMLFSWTQTGSTEIWKMNLDGGGKTQLTSPQQRSPGAMCSNYQGTMSPCYDDCNAPQWASTGLITMFCGIEQQRGEIFTMDASGANQTQLTHDPGLVTNDGPAFSPDGLHIAFIHGDPMTQITTLERIDIDSSHRTIVTPGLGPNYTCSWGG
jgi:Tol biopolymer transport system component